MENEKIISKSEDETIELGEKFAERLVPGDTIAFYGDLGVGKTEFIKGICNKLKVREIVTSPTFTIMNHYEGNLDGKAITIYHIDLYRISKVEELSEIGFEDCIYSEDSIKLIEWAENAGKKLANLNYKITITHNNDIEDERLIKFETVTSYQNT